MKEVADTSRSDKTARGRRAMIVPSGQDVLKRERRGASMQPPG